MSKLLALLGVVSLVGFNGLGAKTVKEDDNKKDHIAHADQKAEAHDDKNKHATGNNKKADHASDHKVAKKDDHKKAAKHKNAAHKEAQKGSKPATFTELDKDAVNAKLGTTAVIVDARKVEKDGDIIKGAIVIPADADDKEIVKLLEGVPTPR